MTLKVLPYAYKITHKETGQFYIGSRTSKSAKHHSEDLGFKYFTSSNYVKELGFENFKIDWIEEFPSTELAYDWEQMMIHVNLKDPLCLNKSCYFNKKELSTSNRPLSDEHKRKISASCVGRKVSEDTKNKISNALKNHIFSEETKLKISKSKTGKKRKPLSEEAKLKISKALKNRSVSDETREKLSLAKIGKRHTKETRNKMSISQKKRFTGV